MTETFLPQQQLLLGASTTAREHNMVLTPAQRLTTATAVAAAYAKASPADRKAIVEFTEANTVKRPGLYTMGYWFLLPHTIGNRKISAGIALSGPGLAADDFREAVGLPRLRPKSHPLNL